MKIKGARVYRLMLVMLLILSMVASVIPAHGMTGQVILNEHHVSSWSDLLGQFASKEDNTKVIIPEGEVVYVDSQLFCKEGRYTITGGGTLKRGDTYSGRLLQIQPRASITLDGVVIDGQRNELSGETKSAIYVHQGSLELVNGTVIRNNKSSEDGGAICNYYGHLRIGSRCLLDGNYSKEGSAIYMVHGGTGTLHIDGSEITNNTGSHAIVCNTTGNDYDNHTYEVKNTLFQNNDGGIELKERISGTYSVLIDGCTFENNHAESGGGLYTQIPTIVKNSTFENNVSQLNGGAIRTSANITLENTNIINNKSERGGGGGLSGEFNMGMVTISGGRIAGNTDLSSDFGDGIRINSRYGIVDVSNGATILDNIMTGILNIHGLLHLEGKLDLCKRYTVTGALDDDAYIEVGLIDSGKLISGADGSSTADNVINIVAVPTEGYTITEKDFNCFKINGNSGHDNVSNKLLGLYMGHDLSSYLYWNESYNGKVVAWRGKFNITWDKVIVFPATFKTSVYHGTEIELPEEPVDTVKDRKFLGWFTQQEGGTQITEDTIYTQMGDSKFYAQWQKPIPVYRLDGNIYHSRWDENAVNTVVVADDSGLEIGRDELPEGGYFYYDLKEGSYTLTATDSDGGTISKNVVLTDDEYVELIIANNTQPPITYNIKGTVKLGERPLAGTSVELYEGENTEAICVTSTNSNGYYEFKDRLNGVYRVVVTYGESKQEIAVIDNNDAVVNFNYPPELIEKHKITGTVKDSKGNNLSNVVVNLIEQVTGEKLDSTTTNNDGSYEFTELDNGVYVVEAHSSENKAAGMATITDSDVVIDLIITVKDDSGKEDGGSGDGDKPDIKPDPDEGGDTKPEPKPDNRPDGGGSSSGSEDKPDKEDKPTPVPDTVKPTDPTPEPDKPVVIPTPVPEVETEPIIPREPIPFPIEQPEEMAEQPVEIPEQPVDTQEQPIEAESVIEEEPAIETPSKNEPAVPEKEIPVETSGDMDDESQRTGANGTFMDTLKKVLLIAAFSLLVLLGIGLILLLLFAWYRRVKIYNNINTDEYQEDEWHLVHKTFIKKEEKGIYSIEIPEEIIEKRITDGFEVEMKKLFVYRHNGDMLMIRIENTELTYSFEIDKEENIVKYNYTDMKVEQ